MAGFAGPVRATNNAKSHMMVTAECMECLMHDTKLLESCEPFLCVILYISPPGLDELWHRSLPLVDSLRGVVLDVPPGT